MYLNPQQVLKKLFQDDSGSSCSDLSFWGEISVYARYGMQHFQCCKTTIKGVSQNAQSGLVSSQWLKDKGVCVCVCVCVRERQRESPCCLCMFSGLVVFGLKAPESCWLTNGLTYSVSVKSEETLCVSIGPTWTCRHHQLLFWIGSLCRLKMGEGSLDYCKVVAPVWVGDASCLSFLFFHEVWDLPNISCLAPPTFDMNGGLIC